MAVVVDYTNVLDQMRRQGLKCNYYHSGAFGFADVQTVQIVGWIGPADSSIRESMRGSVRSIPAPFERNLAALFTRAWRDVLPGRVWVMPASHWAFELDFGNRDWLPDALRRVGVDPVPLQSCNNAAALEFNENEIEQGESLVLKLLERLKTSDFTVAFPNRSVMCNIHHHKQLWWTTDEQTVAESIRRIPTLAPR